MKESAMAKLRQHEKERKTASTASSVRGTTQRRSRGRQRGSRLASRRGAERWFASLPPLTDAIVSELFAHTPEPASQAGVAGNVEQGSTEAFSIGLRGRNSSEAGRATSQVRAGVVVPDSRPPFESRDDTPAVVDHATNRDAATKSAAAGSSSFEHELAPSETRLPPILIPRVTSPNHDPTPTVVCSCSRQPAAAQDCDPIPNVSSSPNSASDPVPTPNVASHSASEAADCGDVAMEEMSTSTLSPLRTPAANAMSTTPAPNPTAQPASQAQALAPLEPSALPVDPESWTIDDVVEFVRRIPGCAHFAKLFRVEQMDGRALLLLKCRHLFATMNIPLGPALKITNAIRSLRGK